MIQIMYYYYFTVFGPVTHIFQCQLLGRYIKHFHVVNKHISEKSKKTLQPLQNH